MDFPFASRMAPELVMVRETAQGVWGTLGLSRKKAERDEGLRLANGMRIALLGDLFTGT
jgi:hypothetical protein